MQYQEGNFKIGIAQRDRALPRVLEAPRIFAQIVLHRTSYSNPATDLSLVRVKSDPPVATGVQWRSKFRAARLCRDLRQAAGRPAEISACSRRRVQPSSAQTALQHEVEPAAVEVDASSKRSYFDVCVHEEHLCCSLAMSRRELL